MQWTLILAEPGHAPSPPWDDLKNIARHVADTLPGTVFDADGSGRFTARTYAVTFRLPAGDPGVMDVEATSAAAAPAVLRVAQKAGWAVIDEQGRTTAVLAGPSAPASSPARSAPAGASGSLVKAGLAVAVAVAVAVAGGMRWTHLRREAAAAAAVPAAVPVPAADPAPVIPGPRGRMIERFRDHPVALQLVAYAEASLRFQRVHLMTLGRDAWVDPAVLARRMRVAGDVEPTIDAFLPPAFLTSERDGYRFTFEGRSCSATAPSGVMQPVDVVRCREAAYIAQPLATGQPSFAFHSDWRLRFREDSVPPSRGDAVVANFDPELPDAAAAAPVTPPAPASPAPSWVATMWATWERAVGATPPNMPLARSDAEGPVDADLRAVAAAQKLYARQIGQGHFTDLARLMQPSGPDGRPATPLLNAAFATPERHGYRFELIGTPTSDDWTRSTGQALGPHYGAFTYVARPLDGKGRTLAVLTDGAVRVATGRVPTAEDPRLGAALPRPPSP